MRRAALDALVVVTKVLADVAVALSRAATVAQTLMMTLGGPLGGLAMPRAPTMFTGTVRAT